MLALEGQHTQNIVFRDRVEVEGAGILWDGRKFVQEEWSGNSSREMATEFVDNIATKV